MEAILVGSADKLLSTQVEEETWNAFSRKMTKQVSGS